MKHLYRPGGARSGQESHRGRGGDIEDVAVVNVDGGDGRVLEAHLCVVVLCVCSLFLSCFSSAEETADERGAIID